MPPENGGYASTYARGIAEAGQKITGTDYNDIHTIPIPIIVLSPSLINNLFADATSNLYLLWQYMPEFISVAVNISTNMSATISEVTLPLKLAAIGNSWNDPITNINHNNILSSNTTAQNINDIGTNCTNSLCALHYGDFYSMCYSILGNSDGSYMTEVGPCTVENLLDAAPLYGPFCHATAYDPNGWATSDRFYDSPQQVSEGNHGEFEGNYNGLDYMLLHNLFYLYQQSQTLLVNGDFPNLSFGAVAGIHNQSPAVYYDNTGQMQIQVNVSTINNSSGTPVLAGDVTVEGNPAGIYITATTVSNGAYFHAFCDNNNCIVNPNGYRHKQVPKNTKDSTGYVLNSEFMSNAPSLYSFNTYPNPVYGQITFDFEVKTKSVCSLEITNALGKTSTALFSGKILDAGHYMIPADISFLNPGIFFCTLTQGDDRVTKKIIKLKN